MAATPHDSDDTTNSAISHGVCQKSMDTISDSSRPVYPMTPTAHTPPTTQHAHWNGPCIP